MISEKGFARGYSSFWAEYFPWLNSYCQSVKKFCLDYVTDPIPGIDRVEHRSINNTVAFFHFKNMYQGQSADLKQSKDQAIDYISHFPRNAKDSYLFSEDDKQVIQIQTANLQRMYTGQLLINPPFSGCGILDNCYGDLLQGETLVEVKAGDRGLLPADIKQLIVYSALDWLKTSSKYGFSDVEIYNPRLGYLWRSSLDELLVSISDMPKEDLFEQIGKYLVVQSEDFDAGRGF